MLHFRCTEGREELDDYLCGSLRFVFTINHHYHYQLSCIYFLLKVAKATVDTTSIMMTRWLLLSKFLHDSSLGHDLRLGAFLLLQDPLQVIIKMMNEDSDEYRW